MRILAWGAITGIAADLLLRESGGLGPNAVILVGLLTLAAGLLARGSSAALPDRWLLTALGLSLCLVWRDSEMLRALNVLAILAALSLTSLAQRVTPWRGLLRDYAATAARSAGFAAAGTVMLLDEGTSPDMRRRSLSKAGPVLAGLAIALPIVAIFAGLFAEADPLFDSFGSWLTSWNLGPLASHAAVILLVTWVSGGLLRAWLTEPTLLFKSPVAVAINPVTIGVVVGSVAGVFVLFIASQSRLLFGGAALIEATAGLTYAEHARRGFFELVAASGLAIPVLYAAHAALAGASAAAHANLRRLGALQLMLIALVMASAFHRVALYISIYGLTVDRFAGMAVLAWLAFVVVWFGVTVLRGRPERFTFGAVVSAFAVLGVLNAANPEAVITRVNTRATESRRDVDYKYLLTLSADAVPGVLASLESRPAAERCSVGMGLRSRWLGRVQDWRSWNRGKARAIREVRRARESTASACGEAGGR